MKTISGLQTRELDAVILAAGYSRRMGAFKPLLPFGSGTIIGQVVDNLRKAGIDHPIVVTGHRGKAIAAALRSGGARTAFHPGFAEGMLSSLQVGIKMLAPGTRAFFVLPGDMPMIRPATFQSLAESFQRKPAMVTYPVFSGRRGHPPLLAMELAEPLLAWKDDGGLRAFLKSYREQAVAVPVADEGILLDLDNQDDYLKAMVTINEIHVF